MTGALALLLASSAWAFVPDIAVTFKASPKPAVLRYREACVLEAVAGYMGVSAEKLKTAAPPRVFYESRTPLKQFQDSIEPQWGFRPPIFGNAFVPARNEIYVLDDAAYYAKTRRFLDDSLAHEYAHFVQVRFQGGDLADDSLEGQAVGVQTWFRDTYLNQAPPAGFCPKTGP